MTLFLLFSFALVNCRQNVVPQGPALVVNLGAEPATIDPLFATDPPTIQLDQLLFANLVQLSEVDGSPQPGLAVQWLVSSDGLTWEFHLRDDAYWVQYDQDNSTIIRQRAITAQDVVYSVRRLFDPRTQSGYATSFAPLIRNAEQLVNADPRTKPEDLKKLQDALGVHAPNDHTVQFQLNGPTSAFPTIVGAWLGRVVPPDNIDANGVNWTKIGTMWTSGPFVLVDREPFQFLLLRKNPSYYDAANVSLENVRFRLIPDIASELDAYLRGEIDSTDPYDSIEGANFERVTSDPALSRDLKLLPGLCTQYIGFNTAKPPFNNLQVRQAFALALNRNDVVSQVFKLGEPARWFTPPYVNAAPDATADIGINFDAPLAKTTLDQSKVKLTPLTFGTNTNQEFINAAVASIQNWRATLAAVITVDDTDWGTYLDKIRADAPPLFRMGYCASYPDAHNFAYEVFRSGSPYNFTRWSSPQYDQLVDQAARETDVLKRRQLYASAEKMLVEDQAVIIPLLWNLRASLTRSNIERTYAIMQGYDRIEYWKVKP